MRRCVTREPLKNLKAKNVSRDSKTIAQAVIVSVDLLQVLDKLSVRNHLGSFNITRKDLDCIIVEFTAWGKLSFVSVIAKQKICRLEDNKVNYRRDVTMMGQQLTSTYHIRISLLT